LSDLSSIRTALEYEYRDDYPQKITEDVMEGYLDYVPTDPASGESYFYNASSDGTDYCLGACFEHYAPSEINGYNPRCKASDESSVSYAISASCPAGSNLHTK
jgi:hypothetical protein